VTSWLERSRTGALVALAVGAVAAIGWTVVPAGDVAAASSPALAQVAGAAAPSAPPLAGLPAFADVIERVKPAVVTITISRNARGAGKSGGMSQEERLREFMERFGRGGPLVPPGGGGNQPGGLGSGFIIDPSGIIVTNNHVVNEGDVITVTLDDGTELPGTVLGTDQATDLAVVKVTIDRRLPFVTFGDSDRARIGDWVVAIGNPFGIGSSVTVGVISARGRDLRAGPYDDYLQIDAAINSGNSGGPVFDTLGRVIGVNTAIFSPNGGNVGIGFAIPATIVNDVTSQLRNGGQVRRGWLGVQIQDVTPDIARSLGLENAEGALIADVLPGGPAERAGVQPGDIVVRFGDKPVKDPKDLSRQVAAADEGQDIFLTVLRDGNQRRIKVDIGDQAAALAEVNGGGAAAPGRPGTPTAAAELGLSVAALDAASRERLGLAPTLQGVLVRDVEPGGRAAAQGLRSGDVIVMVNQRVARTPQVLAETVAQAKREKRGAISLLVVRGDSKRFVAIPLD
jgi:serine protease Do